VTTETAVGLGVVMSAVSGAVVWLWTQARDWRAMRRREAKEDEKTIVDHLQVVVSRLEAECASLRLADSEKQRLLTRAIGHLTYLEGLMEARGIPFRPFDLNGDSATHRPLPAGDGEHDS
jgi:hypothetical protein